jgi:hypothetical protein
LYSSGSFNILARCDSDALGMPLRLLSDFTKDVEVGNTAQSLSVATGSPAREIT